MRLVVAHDGRLYRLTIEEGGVSRPLLRPGEAPSWAGGWAGEDGLGGYSRGAAMEVLLAFGLSAADVEVAIDRAG